MKQLTKIKLINWHYIWNETIPVEPVVFLTGHTGAGKSTIIDALQVVLLGDTKGGGFNKAAMEKSARTLKGYLRGELNDTADGFNYLRSGRFSSYIAIEFHDDVNDQDFTVGIVFDVYEDGSEEHRFFSLEAAIPPNEFISENKVPLSYKDLSAFFKESYPNKFRFFDSNRQYQDFIKVQFGGLKNKYFSLFKKAVSFVPITDITNFITEFVCDAQTNINIEKMQENITQYKRLETEAMNMQVRINALEDIEKAYSAFEKTITNEKLFLYVIYRGQHENELNQSNLLIERRNRYQSRIRDIDATLQTNKDNSRDLLTRRVKIIESRATSGDFSVSSDLRHQKEESQKKLLEIQNNIERVKTNLDKYLNNYTAAASKIITSLDGIDLEEHNDSETEEITTLLKVSKEVVKLNKELTTNLKDAPEKLDNYALTTWRDALNKFKGIISAINVSIGRNKVELERKISALRQQETNLQSGQKAHDSNISAIRRTLQEQLSNEGGRAIDVNFFADLIDVRDEKWLNATEGYLNTQRFALFVEPRFYLKAYETLKEIQRRHGYYNSILVDQERVINDAPKAHPNSLAEEIETNHAGARAYANFLLGRLMKCKNPQEARNSGNGITPEGDLYRNYNLSQINPRFYQEHYIGRKVDAREILSKQKEIQRLSRLLEKYRDLHNVIIDSVNLDVISSFEIENALVLLARIGEIQGLKENIIYFGKELENVDGDGVTTFDHQLDLIDEDVRAIEEENNRLFQEKGQLQTQIKDIDDEKIPASKIRIQEFQTQLDEFDPYFIDEEAEPFFAKLLEEGKTINEIIGEYRSLYSTIQYRSTSTFNEVVRLRKQYVADYRLTHDVNQRDNKVYASELEDYRDVKLPQYQAKIHDAYEKATAEFKDDFLDKLRSAIDAVEDQISELNVAIKEPTFGNDKYHFSVKPSNQYRTYYEMIKDDILLQADSSDQFLDKYRDVIEDLFRQLTSAGSSNESLVQQNIAAFTDYRTYLDFDLIVSDKEGNEQRLSKMIKKKSGGETQTPFYIAVLASFVQLYRIKPNQLDDETNNTMRLIVFDEAFSKMDSNRIKESIRLVRSLGLQVIISAPDDKIADISELVDETLVVLRNGKQTYVKLFKDENT